MSAEVTVIVDGRAVSARSGELVLGVLFAAGKLHLNNSHHRSGPRGCLCGMGVCYECRVTIDGRPGQRACMTPVRDGMEIVTHAS